tara:strand:+ start:3391 stop:3507 length:117 start_codon:yes stop_codon:yes gene_type:complete
MLKLFEIDEISYKTNDSLCWVGAGQAIGTTQYNAVDIW